MAFHLFDVHPLLKHLTVGMGDFPAAHVHSHLTDFAHIVFVPLKDKDSEHDFFLFFFNDRA